jgi:hypothetical protein
MAAIAPMTKLAFHSFPDGRVAIELLHISDRSLTTMPIAWKKGTAASIGLLSARNSFMVL